MRLSGRSVVTPRLFDFKNLNLTIQEVGGHYTVQGATDLETLALAAFLTQHTDVRMTDRKELYHYNQGNWSLVS